DGFIEVNRQWSKKPMDGFSRHEQSDDGEHNSAGETAEHSDFGSTKTVKRISGMTTAEVISQRSDEKGGDMGPHVPAICQQRHRIKSDAGRDFQNHHRGGDSDDDTRSPFRF